MSIEEKLKEMEAELKKLKEEVAAQGKVFGIVLGFFIGAAASRLVWSIFQKIFDIF